MIEEYTPIRVVRQTSANAIAPNRHGWHRRLERMRGGKVRILVRVPDDHPLTVANGWIIEARLIVFEAGLEFYPGDRIFHRDRDFTNNALDNLVVVRPGDRLPWSIKMKACACGCGQQLPAYGPGTRKYVSGHRPRIDDEFSKLPVSRQRQLQLRWKSQGRCVGCGQKPLVTDNHCASCRGRYRARYAHMRAHDPERYERYLSMVRTFQDPAQCRFYSKWYSIFKSKNGGLGKKTWPPAVVAEFDQIIQSYKPNNGNT